MPDGDRHLLVAAHGRCASELAGIRHRFETILTRDDVARGKPSPDLYLLAAARFGLKPEVCVAVEDSNHGVTAAHAAGAITIMVPDMVTPTDETRARCAAIVPDLGAVLEVLRDRGVRKPLSLAVIASEAKQSIAPSGGMDCFVAMTSGRRSYRARLLPRTGSAASINACAASPAVSM